MRKKCVYLLLLSLFTAFDAQASSVAKKNEQPIDAFKLDKVSSGSTEIDCPYFSSDNTPYKKKTVEYIAANNKLKRINFCCPHETPKAFGIWHKVSKNITGKCCKKGHGLTLVTIEEKGKNGDLHAINSLKCVLSTENHNNKKAKPLLEMPD